MSGGGAGGLVWAYGIYFCDRLLWLPSPLAPCFPPSVKLHHTMGILDKIRGLGWVTDSRKGEKAVNEGRFEDALVHLDEAIALNPRDAYSYFYRGLAHGGLGNLNAAIRDLNSARKFGPEDSALLTNLGTCYLRRGQLAPALKEYKKALQLNPKDARALLNIGIVYAKQSESAPPRSRPRLAARALESLDKSIIQDPRLPEAYRERALLFAAQDRLPDAIEDLTYAISLDSYYAEAYEDRARLHSKLGNTKNAKADLARVRQLDGGS